MKSVSIRLPAFGVVKSVLARLWRGTIFFVLNMIIASKRSFTNRFPETTPCIY